MLIRAQQWLGGRRGVDEERLLRLFWNRAELKREFAQLKRERDRLIEHLRQQEAEALRIQQRLERLETLLAEPVRAANAAVYYQLRGVWHFGRNRLRRQAHDLSGQQQELEHRRELARFEDNRQAALDAIERRLQSIAERQEALEQQLGDLAIRRTRLMAFWRYFERRAVEMEEESVRAALDDLAIQAERYVRAREDKRNEVLTCVDGLSVEGRRSVNLGVIALAQELLIHFAEHDVAILARDASLRSVTEANYGGIEECSELAGRISRVQRRFETRQDIAARVQRRTAYLRQVAVYARPTDTVPVTGSFDSIPLNLPLPPGGADGSLAVNVIADEYWEIWSVLLS